MLWYFSFTTVGIAIVAMFATLRQYAAPRRPSFFQIIAGGLLVAVCGYAAVKI